MKTFVDLENIFSEQKDPLSLASGAKFGIRDNGLPVSFPHVIRPSFVHSDIQSGFIQHSRSVSQPSTQRNRNLYRNPSKQLVFLIQSA